MRRGRPSWPEATGLTTIIPDSLSHLSSIAFVDLFLRRTSEPAAANGQSEVDYCVPLPKGLCAAQFSVRKEFLDSFNLSAGLEAILLQHKAQDAEVSPLSAAV